MSLSRRRVGAILRKELSEFRRHRPVLWGMAIVPILFIVQPLVTVFGYQSSASGTLRHEHVLLYLLGIPALVPAFVAAYSVVGERQQDTLEPVLSTPIRRRELVLAKALAALLPSTAVAYAVYVLFLLLVELFAHRGVAAALIRPSDVLAQLLFTPLVAGWSIWLGMIISTRANEPRTAQQLGALAGIPTVAVTLLIALNVIPATVVVGLIGAVLLLLLNRLGWHLTSALFDRERLISGSR